MVRAVWVGGAFVCGIVLGVFGTRALRDATPAPIQTKSAPVAMSAVTAPAPATSAAPFGAKPLASGPPAADAGTGTVAPASAPMPGAQDAPSGDDDPTTRIDVGAAFHQMVDRPSVPGFPNEFGDAHRTLEREARDDSWSDPLEAEIRNSLTADVSSGNIKVEFLECRRTVCEIHLSAAEGHEEALSNWGANSGNFPWSQRVQSVGMSMSMVNRDTHGLWIYRKPPK